MENIQQAELDLAMVFELQFFEQKSGHPII